MYTLLVVVVSLIALLLILIILLQSGKGGGLAAEFGGASSSTDSFMGGRQAANFLTRATWIGGGVYLAIAMLLAVLSARSSAPPESILREEFGQPATPPASILDTEEGEPPPAAAPVPVETPQGDAGQGAADGGDDPEEN